MTMRMAARLPARLVEVDLLRTVDRLFFRTLHTLDTIELQTKVSED